MKWFKAILIDSITIVMLFFFYENTWVNVVFFYWWFFSISSFFVLITASVNIDFEETLMEATEKYSNVFHIYNNVINWLIAFIFAGLTHYVLASFILFNAILWHHIRKQYQND